MCTRLAFASTDGETVDEHFGAAPCFQVFSLDPDGPRRSAIIRCETGEGHDSGRLAQRINALRECRTVFCVEIGQGALRQLRAAGIEAVRVPQGSRITDLLVAGTAGLLGATPKSGQDDPARFGQFLDEGWQT